MENFIFCAVLDTSREMLMKIGPVKNKILIINKDFFQ